MATAKPTPANVYPGPVEVPVPKAWGADVEVLDGITLVEKETLIGVPFIITGVWFEQNSSGIEYIYVEGMREDRTAFTFNDSSSRSGAKVQLESYLEASGKAPTTPGEIVDLRRVIPQGLRLSTYPTKDDRGRDTTGRSWYLTTNNKRRGSK